MLTDNNDTLKKSTWNVSLIKVETKKRESYIRWFSHVQSRTINAPMIKSQLIQVKETKKGRGR